MQSNRCRHYVSDTELIVVPNAPVLLRLPIRRCRLAEHMLTLLSASEAGQITARKLMFRSSLIADAPPLNTEVSVADDTLIRAVFGPDLEPIHHADCHAQRCMQSCTPGYVALLEHFGLTAEANLARGSGCQETAEVVEDAH